MSFGYILRNIQAFKVSVSILKSVPFENDNFLWSTSIELKFWPNIKDIYLMCLPKFQGVWSCWKRFVNHFVFRSQLNELKFWKKVVDIVVHVSPKFHIDPRSYVSSVALQSCYEESLFWEDIKIIFFKWSKYNLGKLEGRSLKIRKCKYIIKTFIQKCGM
jgi:hypothetical protein